MSQTQPMPFIDLAKQQKRIREKLDHNIKKVLDHGAYIQGSEIGELEKRLAQYVGVKYCVGMSSGTDALLAPMMAMGIGPGDEVITSPFTFAANAEMIMLLGAKPVFIDIDEKTYNINPSLLEAAITKKTKAIMPINLYGQCADYNEINAVARKHGLSVIEDAAQSFGATYHGKRSCGLSTIGATSFFPAKPLGCYGDGGACFTDSEELASKVRKIMNHGQDGRYNHVVLGINGRLDTLQAAVLHAKMDIFEDEVKARIRLGSDLSRKLKGITEVPYVAPHNQSVFAQFTIRVKNRTRFTERMSQAGIPTAVHYPKPLHLQPVCRSLEIPSGRFPYAERVADEVVSLPFHPYLDDADLDRIQKAVSMALGE